MSGSAYVSPTAAYIDATGAHAPPYSTILSYLQTQYQLIYGADAYLGNDSQDGQLLGIFALGLSDANSMVIAGYNAFSPNTAQGVGLSSNVKINGIKRLVPTNGTVDIFIVGIAGTQIFNGTVIDLNNNVWALPPVVVIDPITANVTVTATAVNPGALVAPAGTIIKIGTPTYGWQTAINLSDAVPGQPVEKDGGLRMRQAQSTMLASVTVLDGLIGAISGILDVTRVQGYENNTKVTDGNGIPGNTISMVVEGGDQALIGQQIALRKTLGCGTYGTTAVNVTDARGGTSTVHFFRPAGVVITVAINIVPLAGYVDTDGNNSVASVIDYINKLPIGEDIYITGLYGPAYQSGVNTYNIRSIQISRTGTGGLSGNDVVVAFNEAPLASTATVAVNIVS